MAWVTEIVSHGNGNGNDTTAAHSVAYSARILGIVLGSILLTTITIGTSARTRRRFGGHGARRELELG